MAIVLTDASGRPIQVSWTDDGAGNPIGSGHGTAATALRVELPTDGTGVVGLNAGSNVIGHVIADTGSTTAVTGNVTVVQGTGTNLHAVIDSGSLTANAGTNLNTSALALDATVATPTAVYNGKTTVTTAGTRVALASSQAIKSVTIKALATNTGTIYVGNSSVASTNGLQLAAGDTISFDLANLATVNIDASVNSEGVTYLGVG